MSTSPDKQTTKVLIVDDALDNLAYLHDALDESGYIVLVANSGLRALGLVLEVQPDIILLDAIMPEMDGFETCRKLKSDINTKHIPVVFMTGLTEAEHVAAGFAAGGVDYVTKPIRPKEVLARISSHLHTVNIVNQARSALDAFGQATIALDPQTNEIVWQTPLARALMQQYFFAGEIAQKSKVPEVMQHWLVKCKQRYQASHALEPLNIIQITRRLILTIASYSEDQWVVILREESDEAQVDALMATFKLTKRESEVLYWVIKGKTNKDIGDILGASSRTVNKHLEHVFSKMGVETRTAAAAFVATKLRHFK